MFRKLRGTSVVRCGELVADGLARVEVDDDERSVVVQREVARVDVVLVGTEEGRESASNIIDYWCI